MPELIFDQVGHLYTIDGRTIPSVTTVIDEMMATDKQWFRKHHRDRGSSIHSLVRQIAWLEHPSSENEWDETADTPGIVPCGRAFRRFCRETGFQVTHTEQSLYSESMRVAGTLDLVGILGGKVALIDVKSGSVPPTVDLQTAAYQRLVLDSMGIKVDARYSLKLRAESERGEFKFRECGSQSDINVFIGLLNGYFWKQAHNLLAKDRSGSGPGRNTNGNGNRY